MRTDFSDASVGIRRFRPGDVPLLYEAACESASELAVWLPWFHANYSMDETEAYIFKSVVDWEKGAEYNFVIFDVKDGELLGGTALNHVNTVNKCANLGYWVRSSRTRRGVASTATRLIARFGLREIGFHRLEIMAAIENKPSQRVAEKAGAKREGLLRKRLVLHGQPHDAVVYSLVEEDFNS
jgi:RimJ/RimL family protein N-acetyltransferase